MGCVWHGRKIIYTDVAQIDASNVVEVLRTALTVHRTNRDDIDYLYRYYKGEQPILERVKEVRPEINNKIVVNRAHEIVSFKVGYLMGEPVQYVAHTDEADVSDQISALNRYVTAEDKAAKDKELSDWAHICGTSYRMVLPDGDAEDEDEAPFEIYTLDPRYSFVVRYNGLGEPVVMGVKYITRQDGTSVYSCYTADMYFEIVEATKIVRAEPQSLGIPIVEYPLNNARLGAFEIVLPLLDAINNVDSNRLDGVEQFVQALMLFHNTDISDEDFDRLRSLGAIKFRDLDAQFKAEIKYITSELNQSQTQTLVDHLYETVLTICGMPNRNGGSSTSDTGTAVIYRDGFQAAEARAKDSELMFKKSENEFLKLVLKISDELRGLTLKLSSVEIRFTRRNYENITERSNVLVTMLNNPKIAPQLAFTHCGMFSDPNLAYKMSMEYAEEQEQKTMEQLTRVAGVNGEDETEDEDNDVQVS